MPTARSPNPSHSAEWESLIKEAMQANDDKTVTRKLVKNLGGAFFSALGQLKTPRQYHLLDRLLPYLEHQEKEDVLLAALMAGYLDVGRRVLHSSPEGNFRTENLQHYAISTLIVGMWANPDLPVDALADFLLDFDLIDPDWWTKTKVSRPEVLQGYPGDDGLLKISQTMESCLQAKNLETLLPEAPIQPSSSFRL